LAESQSMTLFYADFNMKIINLTNDIFWMLLITKYF